MEKQIIDFRKMPAFQRLNSYYSQNTFFDILGTQRSETHHSAFIAWLLNPAASHNLQDRALRQFLAIAAFKADDESKCSDSDVRNHLISGDYLLSVECVKTEQPIVGLAGAKKADITDIFEQDGQLKSDKLDRFDIWILLHISFTSVQGKDVEYIMPVVIENKIYSKEGKAQTERYNRALWVLQTVFCANRYYQPIGVYLTPSGATGPKSDAFIHLTYQDLVDYVIQPCADKNSCTEADIMINGYIRNLSCSANGTNDNEKEYSILAISETESNDLETIFNTNIFQTTLSNVYYNEAKTLLGKTVSIEPNPVLEQFWTANENLFKVVLYNHFKDDEVKMNVVEKIVKTGNRDTTRYIISTEDGVLNSKPASKSEASFLIFKAYCLKKYNELSRDLTIDELRNEFGCSLNNYYHNRFLNHLFYDFANEVTVDCSNSNIYGKEITETDTWDFCWDEDHILPHVTGQVRSVKMWRQDDFANLIEKAKKLGITVDEQ